MSERCVLAKHKGSNKEYVFSVPDGIEIKKGDWLLVNTKCGETAATATSEVFSGGGAGDVAVRGFGARLPLEPVLQVCGRKLCEFIKVEALEEIRRTLMREIAQRLGAIDVDDDLPY